MIRIIDHPNGSKSVMLSEDEIYTNIPSNVKALLKDCCPEIDFESLFQEEMLITFSTVETEYE